MTHAFHDSLLPCHHRPAVVVAPGDLSDADVTDVFHAAAAAWGIGGVA